jgi:hypothetical protein
MCDQSFVRFRTYDLVLLLFITFWKNVLLTSAWILGPAYTFVHRWLIMANLILPNKVCSGISEGGDPEGQSYAQICLLGPYGCYLHLCGRDDVGTP